MRYYGNKSVPGAHFPFNFLPISNLNRQSNAEDFVNVINEWQNQLPKGMWGNWVVSLIELVESDYYESRPEGPTDWLTQTLLFSTYVQFSQSIWQHWCLDIKYGTL